MASSISFGNMDEIRIAQMEQHSNHVYYTEMLTFRASNPLDEQQEV